MFDNPLMIRFFNDAQHPHTPHSRAISAICNQLIVCVNKSLQNQVIKDLTKIAFPVRKPPRQRQELHAN